eukprot:6202543-Ditylum_brightwellii.AAC.1
MQDIDVHDVAEVSAVSLAEDNFHLDHCVMQSAQLADKVSNVSDPKIWTIIRFDQTPLLTYNGRIYLPHPLSSSVAEWYHLNLNHPGITRTYKTIAQIYFAFDLLNIVSCLISFCLCQKHKRSTKK